MIRVDYTQLDQPKVTLSIVPTRGGYIVWDQACRFYILSPSSLTDCLLFMKAGADRRDWLIDDASVERVTWAAAYSVKVPDRSNVIRIDRKRTA